MRLGYNTNGFAHHRLDDALTIIAELGYESVALTLDHHALNPFDSDLPAQLSTVKSLLEREELHSVIETGARFLLDPWRKHQPTLLSPQESQRNLRLGFLEKAVDIAQALGSDALSFWSGAPVENAGAERLMKRLVEGCKRLCDYAAARSVALAFEPEPGMFIDTLHQFQLLSERVNHESLGLTIDVGHLHCQDEVPIEGHLQRWQPLLRNIHIEDMRRGVHEHLMFGEGEMEFDPILRTLRKSGYRGGVHVELSRYSHDAVSTARRALAFLQARAK